MNATDYECDVCHRIGTCDPARPCSEEDDCSRDFAIEAERENA